MPRRYRTLAVTKNLDFVLYANSDPVYLSQGGLYEQEATHWETENTKKDKKTAYAKYEYSSTVIGSEENDDIYGLNQNIEVDGPNRKHNPTHSAHETISGELGDDEIYGYGGRDILYGDDVNNASTDGGNDTLYGGDGGDIIYGGYGNDSLYGDEAHDTIYGGHGHDYLDGGIHNDELYGGEGDDTLIGGAGNDTLIGGADDDVGYFWGTGNFTITDSEVDRGNGAETDAIGSLEKVFITASAEDETLDASAFSGDSVLNGGGGTDRLIGSDGHSTAVVYGLFEDFDILSNASANGQWTLDRIGGGTTTLNNIDEIIFETDRVKTHYDVESNRVTTVNAIASINNGSQTITGDGTANTFIIGLEGSTDPIFTFDTEKLGEFINEITLPDTATENERLAGNLGFEAINAVGLDNIPFAQELFNYGYDKRQIEKQYEATETALGKAEYAADSWISYQNQTRDVITITDFQMGVDTIVLPSITGADVSYRIEEASSATPGANVFLTVNGTEQKFLFIQNKYATSANDSHTLDTEDFVKTLRSLVRFESQSGKTDEDLQEELDKAALQGKFNQGIISTFNPKRVKPKSLDDVNKFDGTWAGDHIVGTDVVNDDSTNPDYRMFGHYGDDLIQGWENNDYLHGGTNAPGSLPSGYKDDGFDILQGNGGDDSLYGGSGNDILDGGAGRDSLNGGTGADTFIFNAADGIADIVKDFSATQGDKIQIDIKAFGIETGDYEQIWGEQAEVDSVDGTDVFVAGTKIAHLVGVDADSFNVNVETSVELVDKVETSDELVDGQGIETGDAGPETFVFNASDSDVNVVEDFNAAQGDTIQIDIKAFHDGSSNVVGLSYTADIANNKTSVSIAGQTIAQFEGISSSEDIANLLKQIEFIGESYIPSNGNWMANTTDILIGNVTDQGLSQGWGSDYIYGGAGDDYLWGGHHRDVLLGGDGNDTIAGTGHADTLIGGHGEDTFVYGKNAWDTRYDNGSSGDMILDFSAAEGDKLEIDASAFHIGMNGYHHIQANLVDGGTDVLVAGHKIAHLAGVGDGGFDVYDRDQIVLV